MENESASAVTQYSRPEYNSILAGRCDICETKQQHEASEQCQVTLEDPQTRLRIKFAGKLDPFMLFLGETGVSTERD